MGGLSAERPISLKTGRAIWRSLRRQGFRATAIDARRDLPRQLRRRKIDLAYVALHGPGGEDGSVQGLLEWMGIPYTGSGVLASALAMDKVACKRLFQAHGLRTAAWFEVDPRDSGALKHAQKLGFPVVVKPACQGSALGVSVVKSVGAFPQALRKAYRFGARVLVEKFLKGPEITVGVLGGEALPVIEIVPATRSFYDFYAKYAPGGSRHLLPARISSHAARRARHLALAVCRLLGIRAVARVDMIVPPDQQPSLLEVNTIPGMTQTSLLPDAARAVGLDFDQLVLKIAEYSFAA
jgi:D-alanine-D-alanine ligase